MKEDYVVMCTNKPLATWLSLFALLAFAAPMHAATIVQEGSLAGEVGPGQFQDVDLDQFDPANGLLNFVQLHFQTSVVGGGMTTGSGQPVHIVAQLDADYFIGLTQIADTQALVDTIIPNNGSPISFSVFNTDTVDVLYDEPSDVAPWIGTGTMQLQAFVEFMITEDPAILGFGAGGSVSYTVTYDYSDIDADIDNSGSVDVDDLIEVILAWGPCLGPPFPCPADVNGSDAVDVDDLIAVILAWSA